jgi:hypothetical protein
MRRVTTLLGTLAAAALLAVAVPTSAQAANGDLIIDGQSHPDPSGCFDLQDSQVDNHTDQPAVVYQGGNCEGDVVEVIQPGQSSWIDWGSSLHID